MLPGRAEVGEREECPWEIVKISAEAGLMGVSMPEEYDGFGGGILEYCLVAEELSRVCLGIATSVVASGLGAMPILLFGSPEQKKKYLPDIAKGKRLAAFGLTEADAGSDAGAIRASATRELVFQDCFVPKENLIGKEGMGFIATMRTFDRTRPGVGAQGVGVAQGALDEAVRYAREREQFGKKIISFQAVQHMLADMATQVEAARALVYSVSRYIDQSETPKEIY